MKGIYVLIIKISQVINIQIGSSGMKNFPVGLYAYVGSAQNNLEKRVARHLRHEKRLFWHIDYLLNNEAAKVTTVYYVTGQKAEECSIAGMMEANSAMPIAGFGCSDCRCVSHLFGAGSFGFLEKRMQRLS